MILCVHRYSIRAVLRQRWGPPAIYYTSKCDENRKKVLCIINRWSRGDKYTYLVLNSWSNYRLLGAPVCVNSCCSFKEVFRTRLDLYLFVLERPKKIRTRLDHYLFVLERPKKYQVYKYVHPTCQGFC